MKHTFLIILPLPSQAEAQAWERLLPPSVFPDAVKVLMALAMQSPTNVDTFVDDALTQLESNVSELPDAQMDAFLNLLQKEHFLDYFVLMLEALHERVMETTRAVLGPQAHLYQFSQVVSYRPMGAICVELSHVPAAG